ncbi:MAG: hemerythrin family protein [Desulfosporosinus sp.]|nr:hemerythrin family protein [Desulfosporosinus sp.]
MWKDKYKIGVKKIDEQHKELFCRVSEFLFLLRREGKWEDKLAKVKETVAFMQSYVIVHFEDEEAYQKEVNYPGIKVHKEIHDQFRQEMAEFAKRFNDEGYNEVLIQKFASTLLAWLINHVAVCDREIGDFRKDH